MGEFTTATKKRDQEEIHRFLRLYAQQYHTVPLPALALLDVLAKLDIMQVIPNDSLQVGRAEIKSKLEEEEERLQGQLEQLVRELKKKIEGLSNEVKKI